MQFTPMYVARAYTAEESEVPTEMRQYAGFDIFFAVELNKADMLRSPLTGGLVDLARTFVVNRFRAVRVLRTRAVQHAVMAV